MLLLCYYYVIIMILLGYYYVIIMLLLGYKATISILPRSHPFAGMAPSANVLGTSHKQKQTEKSVFF